MKSLSEHKRDPEWPNDMLFAYDTAAGLMDQEEFGGHDADRQMAAFREVARRIRQAGEQYEKKNMGN